MKIYNSLTRTKEEFVPLKADSVSMYVCGPTVYDSPHIGHARSAYIFDVVRRYFGYKGYSVKFVRNVTDVDDKIIEKAKAAVSDQQSAVSLIESAQKISKKYLDEYHDDMDSLGIARPDKEPKATEYVPKMVKFIASLIEKGRAYEGGGDVYFDIKKAASYGKLSNQNIGKMETGARPVRSVASNGTRIASGEHKNDPLDFALWKKVKGLEPSWESPWGRGRPGWHIECSVMSSDILGGHFDIHGGGIDLIFPHHENEIAQSEGAGHKFANYWMHNGLLTINSEKMAKSLGNFISIKDFVAKYSDSDYLKLLFLNTHYRHPVDYNEEKIAEAKAQKSRIVMLVEKLERVHGPQSPPSQSTRSDGMLRRTGIVNSKKTETADTFRVRFEQAMDDDFNMPLALAAIFELVSETNRRIDDPGFTAGAKKLLLELASVFGFNLKKSDKQELSLDIEELIAARNRARAAKDFSQADMIRKTLDDKGIVLEDTKDGTVWRKRL